MFFKLFSKIVQGREEIQHEYVDLLITVMNSPLWDGSNEQLYNSFPRDLSQYTIDYARKIRLN